MDSEIEVNFTASTLSTTYTIRICESKYECSDQIVVTVSHTKVCILARKKIEHECELFLMVIKQSSNI